MTMRFLLLASALLASMGYGQKAPAIGDVPDGSRSKAVHLLRLYDRDGHLILPDDAPPMPYSTRTTCGKCHTYDRIRHGFHFNAADTGAVAGRAGEPWILVDPRAGIQVPLSYRGWHGTLLPKQMGMTSLQFLKTFGRHYPGGGVGENEGQQEAADFLRWEVSGPLEVNCQSCHNADPGASPAEYGLNVMRQNFGWAATAGGGFATVQGSAGDMPDNFDLYGAVPPEASDKLPPTVHYQKSKFDRSGKVLFQVPREIPAEQCAFCHSTKSAAPEKKERWERDGDVHLAAGMLCVDCHRNGLDHLMVRGYEGEMRDSIHAADGSLTCRGCHLGESNGAEVAARRRAPRPEHAGIPPVHFDRMTCTACHSGPAPANQAGFMKTSRAHALGMPKASRDDDALPHLFGPVFARLEGKFTASYAMWPAYWARRRGSETIPFRPETVRPVIAALFAGDTTRIPARWTALRDSDVVAVLGILGKLDTAAGAPVYITGGEVLSLSRTGTLVHEEASSAAPYLWPMAHDVRPKGQALGAKGCADCHATDAAFFFGSVHSASPFYASGDTVRRMTFFQDQWPVAPWILSWSFLFRPLLKGVVIFSFAVVAAVVLLYAMQGLAVLVRLLGRDAE
jgi:hypothetical protein